MADISKITVAGTPYDIKDAAITIADQGTTTMAYDLGVHGSTAALQKDLGIDLNAGTAGAGLFLNQLGTFTAPPSVEAAVTKQYIDGKIGASDAANKDKLYIGNGTAGGIWTTDPKSYIDGQIAATSNADKMYVGSTAGGTWESKPTFTAAVAGASGATETSFEYKINGTTASIWTTKNGTTQPDLINFTNAAGSDYVSIPKASASDTAGSRSVTINGTSVTIPTAAAVDTANNRSVTIDGKSVSVPTVVLDATTNSRSVSVNGTEVDIPEAAVTSNGVTIDGNSFTGSVSSNGVTINGNSFTGSVGTASATGTEVKINTGTAVVPAVTTNSIKQGSVTFDAKAAVGAGTGGDTRKYMDQQGTWETIVDVSGETLVIK